MLNIRAVLFLFLVQVTGFTARANEIVEQQRWTQQLANQFIALSVHCSEKELPNVEAQFGRSSKKIHPSFYGCYDWHSAVHAHWSMIRVLKSFPGVTEKKKIEKILEKHFSKKSLEKELNYLQQNPSFEIPYGYAWFFRLLKELDSFSHPKAAQWRKNFKPLEVFMVQEFQSFFSKRSQPMRLGMHDNSAFSLLHAYDYAVQSKNKNFEKFIIDKAKIFYGRDIDCPLAYEPSNEDFLSPCFTEADLMKRVYNTQEYQSWLNLFLPSKKLELASSVMFPVVPSDPKDPYLGHLIGLMFSKASAMRSIALALLEGDSRKEVLLRAAQNQAAKGIELMFDSGYGGTHWLATYAIYHYSKAYQD